MLTCGIVIKSCFPEGAHGNISVWNFTVINWNMTPLILMAIFTELLDVSWKLDVITTFPSTFPSTFQVLCLIEKYCQENNQNCHRSPFRLRHDANQNSAIQTFRGNVATVNTIMVIPKTVSNDLYEEKQHCRISCFLKATIAQMLPLLFLSYDFTLK